MYCSHLFVLLASPKVLSLDNKNKSLFILYCSHLFVLLRINPRTYSVSAKKQIDLFCFALDFS